MLSLMQSTNAMSIPSIQHENLSLTHAYIISLLNS
jgi:hypothetical protein